MIESGAADAAAVAPQASWGSMAGAPPDRDTAAWLATAGAVKLEPHTLTMDKQQHHQRSCSGSDTQAAAVTAAAGSMCVTDLKAVLARVYPDKQEVRAHMVPVRYLAKLLHGPDVDFSTVQLATLLPQAGLLLAHMRDRVAGAVQGKQVMAPHKAAAHAAALQRVLGCAEVQAELGQQQVLQLLAAARAAEQEFEAAGWQVTSHEQVAPALTSYAAAAGMAAASDGVTAGSTQQEAGAVGLSVAQLLQNPTIHSTSATALHKLLLLVHGREADAAAMQVVDLLPQWPLLQAPLQQRVEGKGEESPLQPKSAVNYTQGILHCLTLPCVQAQFDAAALAQLHQQVQDGKVLLRAAGDTASIRTTSHSRSKGAGSSAAASSESGSEDEWQGVSSDEDSEPLGGAGQQLQTMTLGQLKGRVVGDCRVALNGVAKAAGFAEASRDSQPLPAVLQAQHVQDFLRALRDRGCSAQHTSNMGRHLRHVSQRDDVQRCLGRDSVHQLQQAVGLAALPQAGPESALAAAAAGRCNSKPAASQHSSGKAGHPAGQALAATAAAAGAAAAAASSQPAGQRLLRSAGQPAAAVPASASGLSLSQLTSHAKNSSFDGTNVLGSLTPLRCIAKMLFGDGFDPDAVQVAQLLQHWGDFEAQLLQQVAGTHPTLPILACATALPYTTRVLLLLEHPVLQPHVSAAVRQQLRKQVAATRAAISSIAAAGAGQNSQHSQSQGVTGGQGVQVVADEQPAVAAQDASTADSNAAYAGQWRTAGPGSAANPLSLAVGAISAQPSGLLAPAGPSQGVPPLADAPVRNLLAAQRQLLRLDADKLSPSLSEKLALRSTLQMLAGLPPGDIRLDMFFADYDWVVMLSEEAESTPEHWREAFDTLIANATSGP